MKYYSVKEVATILGVSRQMVHQMIRRKRIKAEKIADVFVIPMSEASKFSVRENWEKRNYKLVKV